MTAREPANAGGDVAFVGQFTPPRMSLGALAAPSMLVGVVTLVLASYGAVVIAGLGLLVGASLIGLALRAPRPQEGELAVTDVAVRFRGVTIAHRDEITAALVTEETGAAHLGLWSFGRALGTLHFVDAAEAQRCAAALGFEPGLAVARVDVRGSPLVFNAQLGSLAVVTVATIAWVVRMGRPGHAFVCVGLAGLALALVMRGRARTLELGADGVRVSAGLQARFVPWVDVVDVRREVYPFSAVVFLLANGEELRLATRAGRGDLGLGVVALARRLITRGSARDRVMDAARMRRGQRTARAWVTELRGLVEAGAADHRRAPATDDALWALLTSSVTRPDERAAAAVALAEDATQRPRLLRVNEGFAMPHVRVAIAAAAAGADEQQVAEALAEVEQEVASQTGSTPRPPRRL